MRWKFKVSSTFIFLKAKDIELFFKRPLAMFLVFDNTLLGSIVHYLNSVAYLLEFLFETLCIFYILILYGMNSWRRFPFLLCSAFSFLYCMASLYFNEVPFVNCCSYFLTYLSPIQSILFYGQMLQHTPYLLFQVPEFHVLHQCIKSILS